MSSTASPSWQKSHLGAHRPWCGDWHCALPSASLQGLLSLARQCWGSPGLFSTHAPAAEPGSPWPQHPLARSIFPSERPFSSPPALLHAQPHPNNQRQMWQ